MLEDMDVFPDLVAVYEEVVAAVDLDAGLYTSVSGSGSSSGLLQGDASTEGIRGFANDLMRSCGHRFAPERFLVCLHFAKL